MRKELDKDKIVSLDMINLLFFLLWKTIKGQQSVRFYNRRWSFEWTVIV